MLDGIGFRIGDQRLRYAQSDFFDRGGNASISKIRSMIASESADPISLPDMVNSSMVITPVVSFVAEEMGHPRQF